MNRFSQITGFSLKKAVRAGLLAVPACFVVAQAALAGIAASPCDPQYYNSLKSRAWLEAQREITQNQNLILKPDSVLEYMCFAQFLGVLADMNSGSGQTLFSESNRWGTGPGASSMDNALTGVVQSAVSAYITANFAHGFLGDRATTVSYTTPASVSGLAGSGFTCANMQNIWREAKCMDFIEDGATDGFYTFEEYRSAERRTRPSACPPVTPTSLYGANGRWQTEFNLATTNANTPWQEDDVRTFFDRLDPANCSSAQPIPTGIIVVRSKQTPTMYNEKVCVAPGCRYVPTGLDAGNCQP